MFLILVLAGALFVMVRMAARDKASELAGDRVRRTVDRMESDLAFFFEPVRDGLRVAAGWASNGALKCSDATCINALFGPVIRRHHQIDAVNTGDAHGRGAMLTVTSEGWRNRLVDAESWGDRARIVDYSPSWEAVSTRDENVGYDPRSRPWYVQAAEGEAGRVYWTAPYTFFTSGEPGITASILVGAKGRAPFVLSFDVRLSAITDFVRRLDAGANGLVFVLSTGEEGGQGGLILGLPNHPAFATEEARRSGMLRRIDELDLPVIQAALRHEAETEDLAKPVSFPFEHEGETWWGTRRKFVVEGAPTLYLGVVTPESDFLQDMTPLRVQIALLTLIAMAGATLVAGWLSRKYSRPVLDLVRKSGRIQELDLDPQPPARTNVTELRALDQAQEGMRKALDSFARYVPTEVVKDLLVRGEAAEIGGRERTLTILFTDIVGFTTVAEHLSARELTMHMSEYFDGMVDALRESGATVDKFVGDAIVAFWGAPTDDPHHAIHGVDAVLRCQRRLEVLNEAWQKSGKPPLPTRFGLATGPVVVGNVGARSRLHYTVLGDTVNLASRLEGANSVYGTTSLVAESTVEEAGEAFVFRRIDRLAVKGRQAPVTVYELLGERDDVPEDDPRRVTVEKALALYQGRAFGEALDLLAPCIDTDAAAFRLASRCRDALRDPPAPGWDGTTHLTTK